MSDKQDVQNSLFKAISTIATKIVENKNFDETKECTIIEVYLDNNGNKTGDQEQGREREREREL